MIPGLIIFVVARILDVFAFMISLTFSAFHIDIASVQSSVAYFLANVFYWRGYFNVTASLNFIGRVVGFISALFAFNVFEWAWHKVPWVGH